MSALALLVPFALIAVLALGSLVHTLRQILPAARRLRGELGRCTGRDAYSFRIATTVGSWDDGTVVALPLKGRPVIRHGLRAAA